MEPNPSGLFTLNEGVLIIPVTDLPEESRTQVECEPGDFAVSRVQSRSSSKIIDADAADLLSRFREARTVVEAVILFARKKQLDPGNARYKLTGSLIPMLGAAKFKLRGKIAPIAIKVKSTQARRAGRIPL